MTRRFSLRSAFLEGEPAAKGRRRTAAARAARFDAPARAAVQRQRETACTRTHGTTTRFSLQKAFLGGPPRGFGRAARRSRAAKRGPAAVRRQRETASARANASTTRFSPQVAFLEVRAGRYSATRRERMQRAARMPRPATPNRNAAKATSNTNAAAGDAQQECREERRATRMPRTRRAARMPGARHPGTQSSPGSSRSTMCIARAASVMLEVSEGYTANTRATWSTVRRRSTAIAMG